MRCSFLPSQFLYHHLLYNINISSIKVCKHGIQFVVFFLQIATAILDTFEEYVTPNKDKKFRRINI